MIDELTPYLHHLGECTPHDKPPMDFSCFCGLREIYHKLEVELVHLKRKIE